MKVARHPGMKANKDIKAWSNSNEKVNTFNNLGSLLTNKNYIQKRSNVELKQVIHVIIPSKTLSPSRVVGI